MGSSAPNYVLLGLISMTVTVCCCFGLFRPDSCRKLAQALWHDGGNSFTREPWLVGFFYLSFGPMTNNFRMILSYPNQKTSPNSVACWVVVCFIFGPWLLGFSICHDQQFSDDKKIYIYDIQYTTVVLLHEVLNWEWKNQRICVLNKRFPRHVIIKLDSLKRYADKILCSQNYWDI
jgi:hypothetical protein